MKRRFAVVLDASGSMSGIIGEAQSLGNETIKRILKDDPKAEITVITFESGNIAVLATNVNASFKLDATNYRAGGGMPLYDAVLTAIDTIASSSRGLTFTVITVTDGQNTDNHSLLGHLKSEIKRLQATDKWTFAFALPPLYKEGFGKLLDIPSGNLLGWTDINDAAEAIVAGVTTTVKSGAKSTKDFFKLDANQVKKKDLKKMRDVTDEVTIVTARAEARINKLVTGKTRKPYVAGTGFYQVTKKERKVSSVKKILVRDKTTGKVYFDGRSALGLPDDQDVKLEPGNLGNYDVFIESQSESNPRIIPRGAMVAIWPEAVAVTV